MAVINLENKCSLYNFEGRGFAVFNIIQSMKLWQKAFIVTGLFFLLVGITFGYLTYVTEQEKPIDLYSLACSRTDPYPLDPEIETALQRVVKNLDKELPHLKKIYNCLDIHFVSNDDRIVKFDAGFVFDPDGKLNRLEILLSDKYKDEHPVLIGSILSHEVTHAMKSVERTLSYGEFTEYACYQEEAEAYFNQVVFFHDLSTEEMEELAKRSEEMGENEDYVMFSFVKLIDFFFEHKLDEAEDPIEEIRMYYVLPDEKYKEQCGRLN